MKSGLSEEKNTGMGKPFYELERNRVFIIFYLSDIDFIFLGNIIL